MSKARDGERTQSERNKRLAGIGLNVILQLSLLIALLVGINVFSFHHYRRFDFSRDDSYRLSPQSRSILRDLREDITVHYLMQPNNPLLPDLTNLLKEMKAVAKDKLRINPISPYADYSAAVDLQTRFQFGMRENIVIVDAGRQHMILGVQDLAQFDTSGMDVGIKPRLEYFTGESAIIGAILATTGGEEKVVLYLTGHGQPDPESDPGMSSLVSHWQRQNVRIEPFDLKLHNEVPPGVAAVILAGPRMDLSEREATILRGYLAQRGRMIVFLSWGVETPELNRLLSRFGIIPRGDRVLALRGAPPVYQLLRDVVAMPAIDHPAMSRRRSVR
ncbi:MAG: GldG family protein [Verrucomicrobiia bacterium]